MKRISILWRTLAVRSPVTGKSDTGGFPALVRLFSALCLIGLWPSASAGAPSQNRDPETPACTHSNIAPIEISLPKIIMRRMRQIPSAEGQAASLFLGKHPNIPLTAAFTDAARAARLGRRTIPAGVFMSFTRSGSKSQFSINHTFLHSGDCDEKCFIASPKAQQEFADTISGSFVHEVSHAREAEERPDMPYLQESEIVAAYREHIFLLDALKAIPKFDDLLKCLPLSRRLAPLKNKYFRISRRRGEKRSAKDKAQMEKLLRSIRDLENTGAEADSASRLETLFLLRELSVSNSGFEARIRSMYPDIPGANDYPDRNIQAADGKLDKARTDYQKIKAAKDQRKPGAGPADFESFYRRLVNTYNNDKSFWNSQERRGKAQEYFNLSLTALRSEADRRRREGKLKPFAENMLKK